MVGFIVTEKQFLYTLLVCCQGKIGNKADDAWIMNRVIKQLTDMGFPVCENMLIKLLYIGILSLD